MGEPETSQSHYCTLYVYRVAPGQGGDFIDIQRVASEIYREHGAVSDETFTPVDVSPRYGCRGFAEAFGCAEDELFVGLARFRDRAHHDEVMERVNADPRIDELFAKVQQVLSLSDVALGSFSNVV